MADPKHCWLEAPAPGLTGLSMELAGVSPKQAAGLPQTQRFRRDREQEGSHNAVGGLVSEDPRSFLLNSTC